MLMSLYRDRLGSTRVLSLLLPSVLLLFWDTTHPSHCQQCEKNYWY